MEEPKNKKPASPLYLGLDFSTQQLKAVCIDDDLEVIFESSVIFEKDLPEFKTIGGVHRNEDGLTVTAPTIMWIKALDMLLEQMKSGDFPFCRLAGVSGSGQQHGSVYWKQGSEEVLKMLSSASPLATQLESCFSIPNSPIWMDSSTTARCRSLETAVGGPEVLARHTGSRAYERFTGNQIAKLHQELATKEALSKTERISLVSSFGATLFLGKHAEIDYSDGSGMNLFDIHSKDWWQEALDSCAPDLRGKLGTPVPASTVQGSVSEYYVKRYGFPADCQVVTFTGDNPASLAGMRLEYGDVVVSLGTSDTLFLWIDEAQPQLMGHIFVNPVDKDAYMALLCYKNGTRAREVIRDSCAKGTWEEFDRLLDRTEPGNNGNIGIYFIDPEITPGGQGEYRFNAAGDPVDTFPPEVEVRAVLEGQLMAKKHHAQSLGYSVTSSSRVLATGGAAQNTHIRQIIADVFDSDVYILTETANSASLGAAYRAKHGLMGEGHLFREAVKGAPAYQLANKPRAGAKEIYEPLIGRYAQLENRVARSV